jgi:predicted Abi (CAAX) family protease
MPVISILMARYIKQSKKPPNSPPDFEAEWITNKPGQHNTQRFERLTALHDTKQKNLLKLMPVPNEIPPVHITTIYAVKNKQWVMIGHKCIDCGKPMNDPEVIKKHSLICKNDKEINRQEEQEILARIGKPAILIADEEEDELYED